MLVLWWRTHIMRNKIQPPQKNLCGASQARTTLLLHPQPQESSTRSGKRAQGHADLGRVWFWHFPAVPNWNLVQLLRY